MATGTGYGCSISFFLEQRAHFYLSNKLVNYWNQIELYCLLLYVLGFPEYGIYLQGFINNFLESDYSNIMNALDTESSRYKKSFVSRSFA